MTARPSSDAPRPASGAERWTHALQAMVERCQKGDVLLLTHDAWTNAVRYCDFDGPVQFMPIGNVVCTFACGVRERR